VTIQFYAMMITALLELYLKQQILDRQEILDDDDQGSRGNSPQQAGTTDLQPPAPSSRLSGVEFVTWLSQKVKKYWKIGIHWLTALRDLLTCPFDERVVEVRYIPVFIASESHSEHTDLPHFPSTAVLPPSNIIR
jgi:hypothetical protein